MKTRMVFFAAILTASAAFAKNVTTSYITGGGEITSLNLTLTSHYFLDQGGVKTWTLSSDYTSAASLYVQNEPSASTERNGVSQIFDFAAGGNHTLTVNKANSTWYNSVSPLYGSGWTPTPGVSRTSFIYRGGTYAFASGCTWMGGNANNANGEGLDITLKDVTLSGLSNFQGLARDRNSTLVLDNAKVENLTGNCRFFPIRDVNNTNNTVTVKNGSCVSLPNGVVYCDYPDSAADAAFAVRRDDTLVITGDGTSVSGKYFVVGNRFPGMKLVVEKGAWLAANDYIGFGNWYSDYCSSGVDVTIDDALVTSAGSVQFGSPAKQLTNGVLRVVNGTLRIGSQFMTSGAKNTLVISNSTIESATAYIGHDNSAGYRIYFGGETAKLHTKTDCQLRNCDVVFDLIPGRVYTEPFIRCAATQAFISTTGTVSFLNVAACRALLTAPVDIPLVETAGGTSCSISATTYSGLPSGCGVWREVSGSSARVYLRLTPSNGRQGDAFGISVRGELPNCTVTAATSIGETEAYAVSELTDYIERLTGVRPIGWGSRHIIITRDDSHYGPNDFRLHVSGENLYITGGKRGVIYGVYELLETYAGVGWYSSNRTVVPTLDSFSVPWDLDVTQTPSFEMREPAWGPVIDDPAFATRLRVNGFINFSEQQGGHDYYFGGRLSIAHTFQYLVPVETYGATHPEYFALRNGVRQTSSSAMSQLCLTNPDVLQIVINGVLNTIANYPNVKFYGVSQNDNNNYCECPNCAALNAAAGSPSGALFKFVNDVAEAVEAVYPGKYIETLAYQHTRHPPEGVEIAGNVVPCLCSIECDRAHPIATSTHSESVSFRNDLAGWAAKTDKLLIWDYTTCFTYYPSIFPDIDVLQPNLRYFRENGAFAVYSQGEHSRERGADFDGLKSWLLAKLMWNTEADTEVLLDRFFPGYYGAAAAPYVRQYFNSLRALPRGDDYYLRCGNADAHPECVLPKDVVSAEFLQSARVLWNQAIDAALTDPDPACWTNVMVGALSVDFTRYLQLADRYSFTPGLMLRRSAPDLDAGRTEFNSIVSRIDSILDIEPLIHLREDPIRNGTEISTIRFAADCAAGGVSPADSAVIEETAFNWFSDNGWSEPVESAEFSGGRAMKVFGTSTDWAMQLDLLPSSFDRNVRYRVRVRVKAVKNAGAASSAEAFRVLAYDRVTSSDLGSCRKTAGEISDGVLEWVDAGMFTMRGNRGVLVICAGAYTGTPALDNFCVDQVEITRIDEPEVARIGDDAYYSFTDAVASLTPGDSISAGDVIRLSADVNQTGYINFNALPSFTLDLNGHNFSYSGSFLNGDGSKREPAVYPKKLIIPEGSVFTVSGQFHWVGANELVLGGELHSDSTQYAFYFGYNIVGNGNYSEVPLPEDQRGKMRIYGSAPRITANYSGAQFFIWNADVVFELGGAAAGSLTAVMQAAGSLNLSSSTTMFIVRGFDFQSETSSLYLASSGSTITVPQSDVTLSRKSSNKKLYATAVPQFLAPDGSVITLPSAARTQYFGGSRPSDEAMLTPGANGLPLWQNYVFSLKNPTMNDRALVNRRQSSVSEHLRLALEVGGAAPVINSYAKVTPRYTLLSSLDADGDFTPFSAATTDQPDPEFEVDLPPEKVRYYKIDYRF